MLKEILQVLRKSDPLAEMIEQFAQMLDAGKWMFEQASAALMSHADPSGLNDELYEKDQQINAFERQVREKIVTHLALGHQADLSACLILMSVGKDAERIGDYAKNIFEIGKFCRSDLNAPEFVGPLEEIRTDLLPIFDSVRAAFVDADRDIARAVLDTTGQATRKCDLLVHELLAVRDTTPPAEAVAYVLMARFYKRVAAHLGNNATSVISPVPMLDYRGTDAE